MTNDTPPLSYDPTTWGKSIPVAIRVKGQSTWHRYAFQDDSGTACCMELLDYPVRADIRDTTRDDRCKLCWPVFP